MHFEFFKLSEVSPRPEDFVLCVEHSRSQLEMEGLLRSLREEVTSLRGRDSGGEQGLLYKFFTTVC